MLVVDTDAQCNASRWLMQATPHEYDPGPTLLHWATGQPDLDGLVRPTPLGPDLVPAHPRMNAHLQGEPPVYLKDLTSALSYYDLCLIDTPPFIGSSVWASLVASEHIIIPIQLEGMSIEGLQSFSDALGAAHERLDTKASVLGIFPNQVDVRRSSADEGIEFLESEYGDLVFDSRLRQRASVAHASTTKNSIFETCGGHVVNTFDNLTNEILNRINERR